MTKTRPTNPIQDAKSESLSREGLVLGMRRFVQFSAVEGIRLTEEDERFFAELDNEGISSDEKRARIFAEFK